MADSLHIPLVDHDTAGQYNNKSVKGYFNDYRVPIPAPNASAIGLVGNTIFPPIAKLWGSEGDIPKIAKPAAGQCGKAVEVVQKPTNATDEKPANATQQVVVKPTESAKAGFNTTAVVVPVVHETTTIEGSYVTVYTSDCLTTSVDATGKVVTVNVPKTVTSTVCPKCQHKSVAPAPASSAPVVPVVPVVPVPASSAAPTTVAEGTVTKVVSTVHTTVSKPAEAPASKPAESVEAEASPAASPKPAESPAPAPAASKAAPSPAGSAAHGTPVVPVAQPSQAQQSTPAVAQANGADKLALGALALLPLLSLL